MSYYIYKICCDDCPDFVYVGSTKAFRQRKLDHKKNCNNGDTKKLYTTIRENGGWDNWRMVTIEDCGEITLTEARIKEEEYRVKLNANLNMLKCYNPDYLKEWTKNNPDKVKEYKKKWDKIIKCECGKTYNLNHKSRHLNTLFHKKIFLI